MPASELTRILATKTRADGSKDEFEYLARGVDIAVGNQVMALNLPGIGMIMVDGVVRTARSRNTPPAEQVAEIVGH